jgi:peptidyl-prolyl cis-trans isomerase B (cyclophilin B)
MEKVKKILLILIVLVLICAIGWVSVNFVLSKTDKKSNPVVTMEVEGYGTIKIELYPDMAPNTVKNFVKLAQRGFYNEKTFTDIEDGLIRGGLTETENSDGTTKLEGPKTSNLHDLADGEKDTEYSIKGEFIENGFNTNTLSHQKGTISMYRKTYNDYQQEMAMVKTMGYSSYVDTLLNELYDSQSGGFFITTEDKTSLDGTYAAFGRVTEGMDVVEKISKVELQKSTGDDGTESTTTKPVTAPVIKNVTVETYGVDYGDPEVKDLFDFDAIFSMFMQNYMKSSGTSTSLNQ